MNIGDGHQWKRNPSHRLMSDGQWKAVAQLARLSPRELEVCQRLFNGHTRSQVAEILGIRPRTVRQHLESIHDKLNVKDRIGVVLRLIQIRDWISRNYPCTSDAHGQETSL